MRFTTILALDTECCCCAPSAAGAAPSAAALADDLELACRRPVAPALLALLAVLAATSADFDRALEPPPPVGVAAAADLGRADRCEEEEKDAATAIVAISGHFGERDSFPPPLRIHASSSSFTLSSFTISDPLRFKNCPRPTSISLSILAAVFLSYVADSNAERREVDLFMVSHCTSSTCSGSATSLVLSLSETEEEE